MFPPHTVDSNAAIPLSTGCCVSSLHC